VLKIPSNLAKGQTETAQRQAEMARYQQQTLEVLMQLVGQ
jgi:hypothetical protein